MPMKQCQSLLELYHLAYRLVGSNREPQQARGSPSSSRGMVKGTKGARMPQKLQRKRKHNNEALTLKRYLGSSSLALETDILQVVRQ